MPAPASPTALAAPAARSAFDPDDYRMSVGEHLEELRTRLVWGLAGLAVALGFCLFFGTQIIAWFCAPMIDVLQANGLDPKLVDAEVGGTFGVYIKISLICAAVLSSPWLLWQAWGFVAAGLYPVERRAVTKYVPLSLALLVAGEAFVYFLVLPWTLQFFVAFSIGIPVRDESPTVQAAPADAVAPVVGPFVLPEVPGNPADLAERQIWYDTVGRQVKIVLDGQVRTLQLGSDSLITPDTELDKYIDLVVAMLLTFGLCFQTPLVVLALCRAGVLEPESLKGYRKQVYLGLAVLAAAVTPGDVLTATVALVVPLAFLFELGIWLARRGGSATA